MLDRTTLFKNDLLYRPGCSLFLWDQLLMDRWSQILSPCVLDACLVIFWLEITLMVIHGQCIIYHYSNYCQSNLACGWLEVHMNISLFMSVSQFPLVLSVHSGSNTPMFQCFVFLFALPLTLLALFGCHFSDTLTLCAHRTFQNN